MYKGDICPVCGKGAAHHDEPYSEGIACMYCSDHIKELIETRWGGIPEKWKKYYEMIPGRPWFTPTAGDLYVVARCRAEVPYEIAEARKTLSGEALVAEEKRIKERAKQREEKKVNQTCERVDGIRASIQKRIDEEEELRKITRELRNS